MSTHNERVIEQFTHQAVPFSNAATIQDEAALQLLVERAAACASDTLLDVACGPGIVVGAFAARVRWAMGIDLTPAMIDRARAIQHARGLDNVSWHVGDVTQLPFADASFSIVTSRFAFHHLLEPGAVLREMARICQPGGRVLVADIVASDDPAKAAALNHMEKLRDPSHTRALTRGELCALYADVGLPPPAVSEYRKLDEVESLLARSFPDPRDLDTLRRLFADSIASDMMGIGTYRDGERIRFSFPVAVLVATN